MTLHHLQETPDCTCDDAEPGLVAFETAVRRGLDLCEPLRETETLALEAALGRVLAEPVRAHAPMPPFDSAAMDGYALRRADLSGPGPWDLPVAGRIVAGEAVPRPLQAGQALQLFTGAPLPSGCDAVVAQERVARAGGRIRVATRPEPDLNIRRAGEDAGAGAEILPAGRPIGAVEATAIAAAGHARVQVFRPLRVAVLCTGSELRAAGEPLAPGAIWNTNGVQLRAALQVPWITLTGVETVADCPDRLRTALRGAAQQADLVVSTGGVSVSEEDHVPAALRSAGGRIAVSGVAMKPGKPLMLGRLGQAVHVGLPGNPIAALIAWNVLGARLAARLGGQGECAPARCFVRATAPVTRKAGRCEFRPAVLTGYAADGLASVTLLAGAFSHRAALLTLADGLALIPADTDEVRPGDLLEFLRL